MIHEDSSPKTIKGSNQTLPSKNGEEGTIRVLQGLAKVLELLLHEEASSLLGHVASNHRAVGPVGGAKGVIDVDIAEL